jgi:hypothetical protein
MFNSIDIAAQTGWDIALTMALGRVRGHIHFDVGAENSAFADRENQTLYLKFR